MVKSAANGYYGVYGLDFNGSYLFIGDESNTINAIDIGIKSWYMEVEI